MWEQLHHFAPPSLSAHLLPYSLTTVWDPPKWKARREWKVVCELVLLRYRFKPSGASWHFGWLWYMKKTSALMGCADGYSEVSHCCKPDSEEGTSALHGCL